jgi:hypothetical protein
MKILNAPVKDLTFDDVVEFCKEKQIEGIQIDYKKDFPQKGLAKHFAAFSNTRGGIIIIGVEEDNKTGLPTKWEGITNEGKLEDRVHQFAANVEPLPDYDVSTTNEVGGKAFLLIRIFEGVRTPYYVQNDSNIWIRTGNISNQIDIASPDALELLFKKRERAELSRAFFINRAYEVYSAAMKRAENERLAEIAKEKEEHIQEQQRIGTVNPSLTDFKSSIYQEKLGTQAAMSTFLLQPYYPHKSLITPLELKSSIAQIRARGVYEGDFPTLDKETIPEGVLSFSWRRDSGSIECEQLYGYGLVFNTKDVLWIDKEGEKTVYISHFAMQIFVSLLATANYYKQVGYQGNIAGYLLLKDVEGAIINTITPDGYRNLFPDRSRFLLPMYRWDIDTDTSVLNDRKELQGFFIELINEIYVGLNQTPPQEALINAFLKQEGWLVE